MNRYSRRNRLKLKKIGHYAEKRLIKRGKEDADNGIVRKNEAGQYFSSFIQQEISLCISQINAEKEQLEKILLALKSENLERKLHIVRKNAIIDGLAITQSNEPVDINIYLNDGESISNDIVKLLGMMEHNAHTIAIQHQIDDLKAYVEITKAECKKNILCAEKEVEITKLRCSQLHDFLLARLSAYWVGVLISKPNNPDFPPTFAVESLLTDVKCAIEGIDFERSYDNVQETN